MTTESTAGYSYAARLANLERARAEASAQERSLRSEGFALPGPYDLSGPECLKTKPDVWAVYKAATAARYEVEFCPGLVLRLGTGTIFMDYFVTFTGKHHQRFHEASSSDMLFTSLDDFVAWLAVHPHPKSPYLR